VTAGPVVALDWTGVSVLCLATPAMPQGGTDLTCMRPALDDIRCELTIAAHRRRAFTQSLVPSTDPQGTGDDLEEELGWSHQRDVYIGDFDALVGRRQVRG
jgi:hypothetical protein